MLITHPTEKPGNNHCNQLAYMQQQKANLLAAWEGKEVWETQSNLGQMDWLCAKE